MTREQEKEIFALAVACGIESGDAYEAVQDHMYYNWDVVTDGPILNGVTYDDAVRYIKKHEEAILLAIQSSWEHWKSLTPKS